jgi:hypothetical protein
VGADPDEPAPEGVDALVGVPDPGRGRCPGSRAGVAPLDPSSFSLSSAALLAAAFRCFSSAFFSFSAFFSAASLSFFAWASSLSLLFFASLSFSSFASASLVFPSLAAS